MPKIGKTMPRPKRRLTCPHDPQVIASLFDLSLTLAIVDESHSYRTLGKDGLALMWFIERSWSCIMASGTPIYTGAVVSQERTSYGHT